MTIVGKKVWMQPMARKKKMTESLAKSSNGDKDKKSPTHPDETIGSYGNVMDPIQLVLK